jgi:hypothetical protein
MRKMLITVDTEALTNRAPDRHVDRLIWGRADGHELGVGRMMDIADNYGAPLSFFLDMPEYSHYGESLLDVGREILRRGHDVQPHMHPHMLADNVCSELHFPGAVDESPVGDALGSSFERLKGCMEYTLNAYSKITTTPARAFRSIGYLLTPAICRVLETTGIPLSLNYNASMPDRCPLFSGIRQPFRWPWGMTELPVSCIFPPRAKRIEQLNFDTRALSRGGVEDCVAGHKRFLEYFHCENGEDAIAVLVLHSRSFFAMDAEGFFSIPDEGKAEKFEAVLKALRDETLFVDTRAVLANNWLSESRFNDVRGIA